MKALVLGSSGFIGSHLCKELLANQYTVVKCDINASADTVKLDILNQNELQSAIIEHRPDVIINLVGQANVRASWEKPQWTFQLNTVGFINISEAIRSTNSKIRLVAVGSSDEYGNLKETGINVTEETLVNPCTPYAISKYSQELFANLYNTTYGMDICLIRLFNLGGSGQSKGYMISDFSSGIAEIEAGKKQFLSVGNLESSRDFTHVDDACCAFRLIVEKGKTGEVYNICSGTSYSAQDILNRLINLSNAEIVVKQDPLRMRPSDTPIIYGNHDKLTMHTGWMPKKDIDCILADSLEYWRNQND